MATEALHHDKSDDLAPVQDPKSQVAAETEVEPVTANKDQEEGKEPEMETDEPQLDGIAEKADEESDKEVAEVDEGSSRKKRGRKGSSKKELSQLKEDSELVTPEKKSPVTPTSERPTRDRKTVERYSAPSAGRSTGSKVLSIEKGRGTQLKDIPNVAFKLSKRKADDNLQALHIILFGKKAKVHSLKRNIGQFSGFVWGEENEEKQKSRVREKIDKCVKEKLLDFCDVLNIQMNKTAMKKEEVSAKLLEFLESPHVTTDILLAEKEKKGKKRKKVASGKSVSSGEASKDTPGKRQKTTEGGKKRKQLPKSEDEVAEKVESPEAKDDSHEDDDNDATPKEESDHSESKSDEEEEEEEEDETKEQMSNHKSSSKKIQKETSEAKSKDKSKPVKKGSTEKSLKSPKKSTKKSPSSTSKKVETLPDATSVSLSKSKGSATKKQKVEKESPKDQSKEKTAGKKQSSKSTSKQSVDVQGKSSKKSKPEPSREEMLTVVVGILKVVDFNTATLSDILRQLGTHFGVDLMHRKAEVKDIITEALNNMSDEEEDGDDAEDNADDGDEDGEDEDDDA